MGDKELRVGVSALREARRLTIDREHADQERLDVADRYRTSALPWRGQFSPQFVELYLREYAEAGSHICDPFAGSGTVAFEAARLGHHATVFEVNPAALELARIATFAGRGMDQREQELNEVQNLLDAVPQWDAAGGLFANDDVDIAGLWAGFHHRSASAEVRGLIAVTLMLAMGDGRNLCGGDLHKAFASVREVVKSLPEARGYKIEASLGDARELPLRDGSVDLIVTSPPYINVFNYHQNYRPAVELLGHRVLEAAPTEIGANRKNRGNRFLTVVQYCIDMARSLTEMARVLHSGGVAVVTVGRESRVLGAQFRNGELLAALVATQGGFAVERRQERQFMNRYGQDIYEDILTLRALPGGASLDEDAARGIAKASLLEAAESLSGSSADRAKEAAERTGDVTASPGLTGAGALEGRGS